MLPNWSIDKMACLSEKDGYANVVTKVWWRASLEEGDVFATLWDEVEIPLNLSSNFVPYSSLEEETVLGWVKEALGIERVEEIEAEVVAAFEKKLHPEVVQPPLPW